MRILVTGATGLLGRTFLESAEESDEIYFISRKPVEILGHQCIDLDLSSDWGIGSLPKHMDIIVHLAQ
jgi:dTDP-4-dehydrorhamnose reductase